MGTLRVGIREARQRLRLLLERVQAGDEIVVLRRGIEVGRIVRPKRKGASLPDLSEDLLTPPTPAPCKSAPGGRRIP